DADRLAAKLERGIDVRRFPQHEALAVKVRDGCKHQSKRALSGQCPGRIAREDIDVSGAQHIEAVLRRERHEIDLAGIVEDGCGKRSAKVHIETCPFSGIIALREALNSLTDAAGKRAAILCLLERLCSTRAAKRCQADQCRRADRNRFHDQILSLKKSCRLARMQLKCNQVSGACRTITFVPTATRS